MSGIDTAPVFREVAPRTHRIDVPLGERFVSLYLVVGEDASLLFDVGTTGMIDEYVLPAMRALAVESASVRHVVLSHCDVDHFGGTADARAAFPAARIVAHERDADAIQDFATYVSERADGLGRFGWREDPDTLEWARSVTAEATLDGTVAGGEEIDLGDVVVRILHVPGHTEGHLALHIPASDALLVSDAVLGASVNNADGTPAFPPTYRFVDDYLASIRMLDGLGVGMLLTAHYPSMSAHETRNFLRISAAFAVETEAIVREVIASNAGVTFAQILDRVGPVAGQWPVEGTAGALAYPVAGHLERLEARGLVRSGDSDGVRRWWPR